MEVDSDPVRVAFLASEADPLVKIGGLGDVAGSLPKALMNLRREQISGRQLDVRLFLPFHDVIRKQIDAPIIDQFLITSTIGLIPVNVVRSSLNGVILYLISCPQIQGEPVYTSDNSVDGEKYTCFSVAVIKFIRRLGWKPDIFHANDWHTAPGVSLLRQKRRKENYFSKTHLILNVHNLPYMGSGAETSLKHFQIPLGRDPLLPKWGKRQPLTVGLDAADQIIAVSPTYAQEIMTPEFGCGLESFLLSRKNRILGILNGLDLQSWDPSCDPSINFPFSLTTLKKRVANKRFLISKFGLKQAANSPLLIFISRLDYQKGIDLVLDGLSQVTQLPWQVIILGTGDPKLEQACRNFQVSLPDRVRVELRFDSQLARQLYAGGDILLMPSRYEPCGLAQMIAMRYGCVPLARSTGGLKDTIINQLEHEAGTGFLFAEGSAAALAKTIVQTLVNFNNKRIWRELQKRGMKADFSWENSAIQYANTYLKLMEESV